MNGLITQLAARTKRVQDWQRVALISYAAFSLVLWVTITFREGYSTFAHFLKNVPVLLIAAIVFYALRFGFWISSRKRPEWLYAGYFRTGWFIFWSLDLVHDIVYDVNRIEQPAVILIASIGYLMRKEVTNIRKWNSTEDWQKWQDLNEGLKKKSLLR